MSDLKATLRRFQDATNSHDPEHISATIDEGDKLVSRNSVTGTNQGEYLGRRPTGRSVTYDEIFIVRFKGGRIAETWGIVDVFSQMRQLGAIGSLSV